MLNYDGDEGFDATINTPGAILERATEVNAAMNRVAQDITESNVPQAFKSAWATFKGNWDRYYANLGTVGGWFDRLWISSLDQIETYYAQLVDWEKRFVAYGGTTYGPALPPPVKQFDLGDVLGQLKWVGLAVGGVWLLTIFAPEIEAGARSIARRKR